MAVVQSNSIRSSYHRLTYLFNEPAHNADITSQRVLACSGHNIKMLHDHNGNISTVQSGAYLEQQFHQSLLKAFNPHRKYQAQSLIISFSKNEFNSSNLTQQSRQALQLTQGFINHYFPDAQSVTCIQADGDGTRLHAHVLISAVKQNGKTIPTNRFSVFHLRKQVDQYLNDNFEDVTNRRWPGPASQKGRHDLNDLPVKTGWQKQIKQIIYEVKQRVSNVEDFLIGLKQYGVTVSERGKFKAWTYHIIDQSKEHRIRAFYQRTDKNGKVIATRGLGKSFTRQSLENYWKAQQSTLETEDLDGQEPLLNPHMNHNNIRKDRDQHGSEDQQDEQLVKLKTIAADAMAEANRKRQQQHLNFEQLKRAKAEERKQQSAKQEANKHSRTAANKARSETISAQKRHREDAQRAIRTAKQRAKSSNKQLEGPDF